MNGENIQVKSKECLIDELTKLKESAKEAVEGIKKFSGFKEYMHVTREVQRELGELILNANKSEKGQLILVCGSVGDGKSHIISYFKSNFKSEMDNFTLHNDATESLEPDKTCLYTLNKVLDNFSDEKIDTSNEKIILAINLGTLNNFIDSEYGTRYTRLRKYVEEKRILDSNIEESKFDENSKIQFINFSDYHIFTLKNGKAKSDYIKSLLKKLTDETDLNLFYNSYKTNCFKCECRECCPIKLNYELLKMEKVQEKIAQLLIECIIKNKIIVSTRALLNFFYELIVSNYVDVNIPTFKKKIMNLNNINYLKALIPTIIFDSKERSFIFKELNSLDPLKVRESKLDDFILEFNNSNNIMQYFERYLHFPKGYVDKFKEINFKETSDRQIKHELLKFFIRSYSLCGLDNLFSLEDDIYKEYIKNIYYWNRGDKTNLKHLYNDIKEAIMKWNGEADESNINILVGKNQTKYKISEEIELRADLSNLPKVNEIELKKFLINLSLIYKTENAKDSYEVILDFSLYKLLKEIIKGYVPNKKDKNQFISFVEFMKKIESLGTKNKKLIFTEKNRKTNRKYKLEYNSDFDEYSFVEI